MLIARVALACLVIAGVVAGCRQPAEAPPSEPAAPSPSLAPAPNSLGRAEMVAALALAASAHSAGAQPEAGSTLAGRIFSLRLPFGCFGPADAASVGALALVGDGLASWTRTTDGRGHVLTLKPLDWTRSGLVTPPGVEPTWEAVDGFWIARPWLAEDVCPTPAASLEVAPAPAPAVTPETRAATSAETAPEGLQRAAANRAAPFTAGLAAIRPAGASRLGQRPGQTFTHTVRATGDAPLAAPPQGYRLVLEGRIGRFPDGRAVRCSGDNPNRRPVCVAAVALDQVAFETASGVRLAQWRLNAG